MYDQKNMLKSLSMASVHNELLPNYDGLASITACDALSEYLADKNNASGALKQFMKFKLLNKVTMSPPVILRGPKSGSKECFFSLHPF